MKYSVENKDKLYYFSIKVKALRQDKPIEFLYWNGFNLHEFVRWKWYFKYREALLRVKYPKHFFDINSGFYFPEKPKDEKKVLKNKITSAKRNLTKWKNKLNKYKETVLHENKSRLIKKSFDDDPNYEKAILKIEKLEFELKEILHKKKIAYYPD
ncbi:hypothetical protein [Mesonia aquimarina]|uniref:hypothetical protein n=1 Tax=Mesonia aquimarina TaxID=1504967 RepID=UPI000EF55EF3|nr:hypothetical protein [Mesonia aquimarina]